MPTLLDLEESLDLVRVGLEKRALRISGRVGQELAAHVGRPGKMLRSRFCLLLGSALGVDPEKARAAARAMELVHNASLLHDDCVDLAELRRGRPTPNGVFGTNVALLLGDLAFSQGLEEAVDISPSAARYLVTTVREMTIGELQEEFSKGSIDLSVDAYLGIASRKTGALFEWSGSVLSELSPFPHSLADPPRLASGAGILLQIVDDIHDYTLAEDVSGKDRAKDLAGRRLTLPAILALRDPDVKKRFLTIWDSFGKDDAAASKLAELLDSCGAVEESREQGREIVRSMLKLCSGLPCRPEGEELAHFIEIMAKREF